MENNSSNGRWEKNMVINDGAFYHVRLVTYSDAPGYRHISLTVEINGGEGGKKTEVEMYLTPEDAIRIMQHVQEVNRVAWKSGKPLDAKEGEQKPRWLSAQHD